MASGDAAAPSKRRKELKFVLNGEQLIVADADPSSSLGDFLRDRMRLRGLKLVCRQGGCGACTVLMSSGSHHLPVNSCLRPLCSVDGTSITTIEAIGSCKKGMHPIQDAIVKFSGTQCGFCTPGMVMSMYGLLQAIPAPSERQVEDQIDGNLCRCTGYRPILDAFQSFSSKRPRQDSCVDIEDLGTTLHEQSDELEVTNGAVTWIKAASLSSLYRILKSRNGDGDVQLVCGNTSSGVYPRPLKGVVIDISRVPELTRISVDSKQVQLGGASSLSTLVAVLSSSDELRTSYDALLKHLKRVANQQVRNVGSVAGNIVMAYRHPDFVSDVVTLMTAADARLSVYCSSSSKSIRSMSLEEFFGLDSISGMVILSISIPRLAANTRFLTYKVALRRVNSHAILNAGFKFEVDTASGTILRRPVVIYGGVKAYPARAAQTEEYLAGKCYMDSKVFDVAIELLAKELDFDTSFGQTAYRASLAPVFLYKAILSLWPESRVPQDLRSSIAEYPWAVTSGTILYDKGDPSQYPVSKPLPKLSASTQATGEVQYVGDLSFGDEVYAKYVLSTVGSGKIKSIDPGNALATKGVLHFICAKTLSDGGYCNAVSDYEEVFASDTVSYYGQAIGLIVATSQSVADSAAKLVAVEYTDVKKPIITIEDAIASDSFFKERRLNFQQGSIEKAFAEGESVIEGQVGTGHQFHFHLETQRAICVPSEDGFMEVFSSTQNPSLVQHCVGVALNRPQHKITVNAKRAGGAFGAKINRASPIAMACACAADMLQRPVRLLLDLETNMQLVGGRSPYLCKYKVSAKSTGEITGIKMDIFNNHGAHFDFDYPDGSGVSAFIDGAYKIPHWQLKVKYAKTNLPACTWARGPVFVETTYMIESVIEHVATSLNLEPDKVRELNMYRKGDSTLMKQRLNHCNAMEVFQAVKASSNYNDRRKEVTLFNQQNRWVKRGISIVPVKFLASWEEQQQLALVNIYPDASVSIHQSGCEIGQGLDVKVAQAAALALGSLVDGGVPMENICVHTTTTIVANNVASTGGSVTSEMCAKAVHEACKVLVGRLQGIKKLASSTKSGSLEWKELIENATNAGVDLQARGRVYPGPCKDGPFQYVSFGAAVTEVEVDILTGEAMVRRVDALLDCGKSLNPTVDVGQVQGAIIQGLGYYITEEYRYDSESGKLLTDGTWEYKPPSQREIPLEFHVALLPNSDNPSGFLRSKFSGEPPFAMACGAILAIAHAIASAKLQLGGNTSGWLPLTAPATPERVALAVEAPLAVVSLREMLSL